MNMSLIIPDRRNWHANDLAFYWIRAGLREPIELGLLEKFDDSYQNTQAGLEKPG
jgi:hypothetical protein